MQHATDAESEPGLPLSSAPFPAIGVPGQAVPHAALEEARRRVLEALDRGAPVVALVGAAGTGKTLLLGQLAEILRGRQDGVLLLRTTHDLVTYRAEAGDAALAGATVLLDEADRAGDEPLASLLGAGQATTPPPRVLVGLPPLLSRLQAMGRPAVAVTLGPVSRAELPGFIAARLAAAGYPPDLFAPEAVEELARRSGGVPRLVNVLTKAAAFAASLDGSPQVLARHVGEATRHAAGIAPTTRPVPPGEPAGAPIAEPRPAEGGRPPARTHLVDAAAEWVDGLRPLPPSVLLPPAPAAPASRPLPEAAAPVAASPAAAVPPVEAADEIAIPPQPEAEVRPVLPAAERVEVPVPAAPVALERETPAPPPVAGPALVVPTVAPSRPRRGGGWVLAGLLLLLVGLLVGGAVAVERSRDAAPGSPLARLAPIRAWVAERTDLDRIMAALRSGQGAAPAASPAPAAVAPEPAALAPAAPLLDAAPAAPLPDSTPAAPAAPQAPSPTTGSEPATPQPTSPAPASAVSEPPVAPAPVEPAPLPEAAVAPQEASPPAEPAAPAPVVFPPVPPVNQGFLAPPPPPALPEPPAAADTAGPPARVIVHFLSATPQERSERLLAGLSSRFPDLQVRRGGRGPSFAAVRHFLPADAGRAETIAALLLSSGVEARVQDFSSYRPRPRPGTIEVWLP